ncbi:hypothetical protein NBRC116493_27060 [Aurantivibrio infirmus]
MTSLIVDIEIPVEEYQRLYAGTAKDVYAVSRDGKKVRFPAKILVPFVGHSGVSGSFIIGFNNDFRFESIEKIS